MAVGMVGAVAGGNVGTGTAKGSDRSSRALGEERSAAGSSVMKLTRATLSGLSGVDGLLIESGDPGSGVPDIEAVSGGAAWGIGMASGSEVATGADAASKLVDAAPEGAKSGSEGGCPGDPMNSVDGSNFASGSGLRGEEAFGRAGGKGSERAFLPPLGAISPSLRLVSRSTIVT